MKPQTKAEKLMDKIHYSSNQRGISDVGASGVARPHGRKMISQKYDKPTKAMKITEIFDTYFKKV